MPRAGTTIKRQHQRMWAPKTKRAARLKVYIISANRGLKSLFMQLFQKFSCGRDAGYPTPPAQIPACGFPAPGSSGILASVVSKVGVAVFGPSLPCLLFFSGRFACLCPALQCPGHVSFEYCVSLSPPSPCDRPYRLRVL